MPLSLDLARRLISRYRTGEEGSRPPRLTFVVGGVWFCPGCGVRLSEADGDLGCPSCGRLINDLIRILVELHPHA
jgi:rubrerythrin